MDSELKMDLNSIIKGHQASAMSLPVKTSQKQSLYKKFFPIMTLFVMVRLLGVVCSEHIVVGKWYIVST